MKSLSGNFVMKPRITAMLGLDEESLLKSSLEDTISVKSTGKGTLKKK